MEDAFSCLLLLCTVLELVFLVTWRMQKRVDPTQSYEGNSWRCHEKPVCNFAEFPGEDRTS